jgi:hypothetical protein
MTTRDRLSRLERRAGTPRRRILVLDPRPGESLADAGRRQFPAGRDGDVMVFTGVPRVEGSTTFTLADAKNFKSSPVLAHQENRASKAPDT